MKEPVLTPQKMGAALLVFEQSSSALDGSRVDLQVCSSESDRDSGYPVWAWRLEDLTTDDLAVLRVMTARVEAILISQRQRQEQRDRKRLGLLDDRQVSPLDPYQER